MSKLTIAKNFLKRLHSDERGLEALQVVMILAVAAIVMMLVRSYYDTIQAWTEDLVTNITGWTDIDSNS